MPGPSQSLKSPQHVPEEPPLFRGQHEESGVSPQTFLLDPRFTYCKDTSVGLI